jgi:predicted nucleic acid-binding protein
MPAELVVDASVLARVLFDEPGAVAARDLLAGAAGLVAPDLIHAEITSVAAKRVARKLSSVDEARRAVAAVGDIIDETEAAATLTARALDLALELGISAYDALYVALAERRGAVLLTGDAKLAARCGAGKRAELMRLVV